MCDCGQIKYLDHYNLIKNKGFGCRKCYGKNFRGKVHPQWNSNLRKCDRIKRRNLFQVKEWRNNIYKRDNYTCQITKIRGGNVCAHHLESWHSNKKLRFVLINGITILQSVHKLFHELYGRKNNTKQQFEEFTKNLTKKQIKQLVKSNERRKHKQKPRNKN